jgi:hypothetical protein
MLDSCVNQSNESNGSEGVTKLLMLSADTFVLHDSLNNSSSDTFGVYPRLLSVPTLSSMCGLSTADRRRLFTLLARWQERNIENAALIACGCGSNLLPFAPIEGYIQPVSNGQELSDDEVDEVGWNLNRSRVQILIVGGLNLVSSKPKYFIHNTCCDLADIGNMMIVMNEDNGSFKTLMGGKGIGVSECGFSIFLNSKKVGQHLCGYKPSFTDCRSKLFKQKQYELENDINDMSFNFHHSFRESYRVICVVGPIIGCVTQSSVQFAMEFDKIYQSDILSDNTQFPVEVVVSDCVSSVQHVCRKFVKAREVAYFAFDTLVQNRAYKIYISDIEIPEVIGCFRTTSGDSMTTNVSNQQNIRLARADREKDLVVEGIEQTLTAKNCLLRAVVIDGTTPSMSLNAGNVKLDLTSSIASTSELVAALSDSSRTALRRNLINTTRLEEGLLITKLLREILVPSYNDIDLIIHVGSSVDISMWLEIAIDRLFAAETVWAQLSVDHYGDISQLIPMSLSRDVTSNTMPSRARDFNRLCLEAEEALRDAYRLHWGSSYMRNLLSSGSHFFVSSYVFDLLRAAHAVNLSQLSRDLSPVSAIFSKVFI